MLIDAIVLAGGRSSRLGSVPKSEFVVNDSTLLSRTLSAAATARRIAVVGHEPSTALPDGVLLVREEPPFGGPVAAIAAGFAALATTPDAASEAILVLACDMPLIGLAVPSLLAALDAASGTSGPSGTSGASEVDGVIAIDDGGHRQPLAAVYRTGALEKALGAVSASAQVSSRAQRSDPFAGLAMFRLLDHVRLVEVRAPQDATADVDTWDDARRLGATPPAPSAGPDEGAHHE